MAWFLLGCGAAQSSFEPAGRDAAGILEQTVWMSIVGLFAWFAVLAIGLRALGRAPARPERAERVLVGLGGVAVPTVLLTLLVVLGLPPLPAMLASGGGELRIDVSAEQWWWRVRYHLADGSVELANELRLPVGRRTPLVLRSPDVIHSLWVPSLHGKMDAIPGRVNAFGLEPVRPGAFRGACAEYCGNGHAGMALWAVALAPEDFARWLLRERSPAREVEDPVALRGRALFLANGCGACHTVRGTPAVGTVGPDLTHVGSRISVGAGLLRNDREGLRSWIAQPARHKPAVRMPSFDHLPEADLDAIAAWLDALE